MDKFWLTLFGFVVLAVDRLTQRPNSAPAQAEPEPEEEAGPPAHWQAQFGQSRPPAHWLKELERAEAQPEWLEYSEIDGQSEGVWPLTVENQEDSRSEQAGAQIRPAKTPHQTEAIHRTRASNRSPLLHPVSRNAFNARVEQDAENYSEAEPSQRSVENPQVTPSPDRMHAIRPDAGNVSGTRSRAEDRTGQAEPAPSLAESEAAGTQTPTAPVSNPEIAGANFTPREDRGRVEGYPHPRPLSVDSPAGARSARRGEEEQNLSPAPIVGETGRSPRADPEANYGSRAVDINAITDESEHDPRTRDDRPVAPTQKREATSPILAPTRAGGEVLPPSLQGRAGERFLPPSPSQGEGAGVRVNVASTPISPVGDQSGKSKNPPLPPLRKGGKNPPALTPLDKGGQGGILRVHPFPDPEESTKTDPSWADRTPQAYGKWPSLDNDPPLDELDWAEAAQALERIARLEHEQGGL